MLTVVAVVLKILFSVNACTLDFSSYQKEQTLSEMNVFLGLIRVCKPNLRSGNRTILFLGEWSDHFGLKAALM